MNVRCSYCRHSFNLRRDFLAYAIAQASEKGQKHYAVECVNCRKMLKVSVREMRRYVPAETPETRETAQAAAEVAE